MPTNKILIAATALLAGTAVLAQTPPPAPPAPVAPPAPPAHPMQDNVMTRDEVVAMVREHFGKMDTDRNGAITKTEIDGLHTGQFKDFKGFEGRGHAMRGDPNAAFDRLDSNKDGSISREEFGQAREERIERRIARQEEVKEGAPKDGKEVGRHVRRMHGPGGFGGRMIVMADTNSDGQITLAEAETLALQHFDQMDANKDGQVTREERRTGRQFMIKRTTEQKKNGS
jgi:Ca2+-binding EF-hand superfamily protein